MSTKVTNCLDTSWKFLPSLPLNHCMVLLGNVKLSVQFISLLLISLTGGVLEPAHAQLKKYNFNRLL
jgi:hypothetical protein